MTKINVDHINPSDGIDKNIEKVCFIEPKHGKPFIRDPVFLDNTILIIIGITGKVMKGQVMISFEHEIALI